MIDMPYRDTEELDGTIVHWLGIAVVAHPPSESQGHNGKRRRSWNDWARKDWHS